MQIAMRKWTEVATTYWESCTEHQVSCTQLGFAIFFNSLFTKTVKTADGQDWNQCCISYL